MADEQEFSMFELGSGLPLEGLRCHSTEAIFTYNQEYTANAVVLDITWQPEDATMEPQHQLYSVGQKWEPLDNGEAVGHTSGKRSKFNDQTNIGRLITSYVEGLGGGDFEKGIKLAIQGGMEPDHAAFWRGIDATLKSVKYETLGRNADGTPKMGNTFVIGELHGRVGEEAAPAKSTKATSKTSAASAPAESNGGGDDVAEHLGQALYRKLKKAAKDAADHDAFMDAAFEMDEVTDGTKEWKKQTERIIMDSSDDSLFAEARS
jgi:hypothetical protein